MTISSDARGRVDDAQAQIERLREQVDALMKDRITPAVADFAGKAESMLGGARDTARHQADALAGRVRQQPLIAIGIAALVGWIIGRASR